MKKLLSLITALIVMPGLAMAANTPPPAPPPQNAAAALPAPKVLVINRQAILQSSKVGQDIARQAQAYAAQAKADMDAQGKALQTEGQALQQQIAILAPDVKQKKIDAFQAKEAGLQAQAQKRESEIQGGLLAAQTSVENVLGPILQSIMVQRGANLILDKNAVVFASTGAFDITQTAIDQLNQKMSSLKMTLQMPPPGGPPLPQQPGAGR
jgi:Skp family chaperone for outer membrane proteins